MIFVILLGAEVFNAFLALTSAPELLALWIGEQGWPPFGVLAVLLLAYIVLGAVMDELAMILLTLPIFFPVVTALDFGLAGTEERRSGPDPGAGGGRHRADRAADRAERLRGGRRSRGTCRSPGPIAASCPSWRPTWCGWGCAWPSPG